MSYDIHLRAPVKPPCPTCGHQESGEEEYTDPTYNLTPLFDLALTGEPMPNADTTEAAVVLFGATTDRPRGLRLLSGKKAADTLSWLRKALANLRNPALRDQFEQLAVLNKGWGTHADAIEVIERLIGFAERLPGNTWDIH